MDNNMDNNNVNQNDNMNNNMPSTNENMNNNMNNNNYIHPNNNYYNNIPTPNPVATNPQWPMFWLGVVVALVINILGNIEDYELFDTIYIIFGLAYFVFSIVYAAAIYPSYFRGKPMITSSKVVAFLNGFCGNLIFGLCWQFNLKKNEKGVSNVVFIVLSIVGLVLGIIVVFFAALYFMPLV